MAVLNKGKIEQIGRPQDLYLRPGNLFVAGFMGETNLLPGKVVGGDGTLEVETAIGRLRSTSAPASIRAGSEVTVSVRPEAIRLGDASAARANAFDGVVHDTVYLGEVAQHRVSIGGDNGRPQTELKAFELNPKFVARDEARQRAGVWIDPADVVVLQR
jgi:spermidine/putrescine transport system ATP-binding protein